MAWQHRLIEKDVDAMQGVCASCGPCQLSWKTPGNGKAKALRCKTAIAKQKGSEGRVFHGHGLTLKEARAFCVGKVCAICRTSKNLCVDHDHATGKIRGVLCKSCNAAIGLLRDSPETLRAAAEYLEKDKGPG